MIQAVPFSERDKLDHVLNQLLNRKVKISRISDQGTEIGDFGIYEPYMNDPLFLSALRNSWPLLANTLTEVYTRPLFDISAYLEIEHRIEKIKKVRRRG